MQNNTTSENKETERRLNINWYPGHMAKTRRLIGENIKLVDVVVELLDARMPLSSKNGDIDDLIAQKPRLVVLNKADLADESANRLWADYFRKKGSGVLMLDSLHAKSMNIVTNKIKEILKEKLDRQREKGMVNRAVKVMVTGIPNVGKSSFINRLAGRSSAQTGDRPGVTRGKQWIRLKSGIELLDTPGILPPKIGDERTGLRLAWAGSIRDEILDTEELAAGLLEYLAGDCGELLKSRYRLEDISGLSGWELLAAIGKRRGFVISGGEIDTARAASIVLDEFRSAKIGRISLEKPTEGR